MRDAAAIFLIVLSTCVWLLGGDRLPASLHWGSLGVLMGVLLPWSISLTRDLKGRRRDTLRDVGRSELARHVGPLLGNSWRQY